MHTAKHSINEYRDPETMRGTATKLPEIKQATSTVKNKSKKTNDLLVHSRNELFINKTQVNSKSLRHDRAGQQYKSIPPKS